MAHRKGSKKASKRDDIDDILDDLLASDEDTKKPSKEKANSKPLNSAKSSLKKGRLTSEVSDAEFYRSLKAYDNGPEENLSEEEDLSDDAARKLTEDIGDLDDLDNDLFAGLGGGKKTPSKSAAKPKPNTATRKSSENKISNFDPDDPLADLGLSEDDISPKHNSQKRSLSRRLSNEKLKVQPTDDKQESPKRKKDTKDIADTFMSSGAKNVKPSVIRKASSFDDSENELSPSHKGKTTEKLDNISNVQSGRRGQQTKPTKKAVDDDLFGDDDDLPGLSDNEAPTSKVKVNMKSNINKQKRNTASDDLFGNDDDGGGLPGFSDDERSPKRVAKKSSIQSGKDDIIPSEKASSALTNLLGNSNRNKKKSDAPTMLDQILAGKTGKDVESPKGSPSRKTSLSFGGYSPSASLNKSRPNTTATSRSVHYADDINLNDSLSRPSTVPANSRTSKVESPAKSAPSKRNQQQRKESKSNSDWLGLGDDLTDELGASMNGNDFFSPRRRQKNATPKKESVDGSLTLPWESPSRKTTTKKEESKQVDQDAEDDFLNLLKKSKKSTPKSNNISNKQEKKENNEISIDGKKVNDVSQISNITSNIQENKPLNSNRQSNTDNIEESETKTKAQNQLVKPPQLASHLPNNNIDHINQQIIQQNQPVAPFSQAILPQNQSNQLTNNQATSQTNQQNISHNKQIVQQENLALYQPNMQPNYQDQQFQPHLTPTRPHFIQTQSAFLPTQPQTLSSQPHLVAAQPHFVAATPPQVVGPSSEELRVIEDNLKLSLEKKYQEEFNAAKRQFERDNGYMESNLKELQEKILKLEETRNTDTSDYSSKLRDLEKKNRKLELEKQELIYSQENMRKRHEDEMEAITNSHKNRTKFLEESFLRREKQLIDEHGHTKSFLEDQLKLKDEEKLDLTKSMNRKIEILESNHQKEIARLKELHKKSIEEVLKEHEEQMNHMRVVKEQEINAAVDAFSHTKSLKTLMQEVQNSTREVSSLQNKIDAHHKSKLEDREMALKSREQYISNLEERLLQQESNNEEERQRLQMLVSKMEVQLREQTRQIEQDRWKLTQDENRLRTLKAAFEEERKLTNEKLFGERDQISQSRDELLAEQRNIMSECYEEKRRLAQEKSQLLDLQKQLLEKNRLDRSSVEKAEGDLDSMLQRYEKESSTVGVRLTSLKMAEEKLLEEKAELMKQQKVLDEEMQRLNEAGIKIQKKSEEVEEYAIEAKKIHEEGEEAIRVANLTKTDYEDRMRRLEVTKSNLKNAEKTLKENEESLEKERKSFMEEKNQFNRICQNCGGHIREQLYQNHAPSQFWNMLPPPQSRPPPENLHQQEGPYIASTPIQQLGRYGGLSLTPRGASLTPGHLSSYENPFYGQNHTSFSNNAPRQAFLPQNQMSSSLEFLNKSQDALSTTVIDQLPPPDVIVNDIEFKRKVRRYEDTKMKDDSFFEEETRFLKTLQEKRSR